MEGDTKKQLKIKSGIVKRITREFESYQKEIVKDKDRIEKLRDNGAGEHEIRKQEEVLQETISMVPNTRKRLQDALEELTNFMKDNDTVEDLITSEEWTEATTIVGKAQETISG
jgi:tubulin-specific chaperone A